MEPTIKSEEKSNDKPKNKGGNRDDSRRRYRNAPRGNRNYKNDFNDNKDHKAPEKLEADQKQKIRKGSNLKITPPGDSNQNWKRGVRSTALWVAIFASVLLLAQLLSSESEPTKQFLYTEFVEHVKQDKVTTGTIVDRKYFYGELNTEESGKINNVETPYKKFVVTLPPTIDSEMLDMWESHGIKYTFKEDQSRWIDYLFQMLPWLLLILFWFFLMRRMQGGANKNIFSFGKSRARVISNENPEVVFNDVAGCDEAKEELREIVSFLKSPQKYQRLGGKIPRGALLLGPPGTGKTLLARAVAGEAGVPFYSLSGADFVEMFVGVGASRVRDLFEQGKKNAPCIIFIDEIDAVGRQRGAGMGGGHDEREQTLNALLVEMDGFETTDNVILIAATNRPDVLDSALLRPGRFDRQIVVDTPDVRGREGILKVHTKSKPLSKDVDLKVLAKGTPGMSGADLANMVNEASLLASRRNRQSITMIDFEEAKDKLLMGIERRSMVLNENERKTTAVHEAGHALVAKLTKGADPVHKVSIIPRGRALGLTAQLPVDDRHNYSREYIEGMLAILMGGRVAEELILNQMTTGAGNDIERATGLARKMVCEWGMSDKLGPMTFGQKQEEIFIGRDFGMHRDFSEELAHEIDQEVRAIITKAKNAAESIINNNKPILLKISELLLERENVDGHEIDLILEGKEVPLGKVDSNRNRDRERGPGGSNYRGQDSHRRGPGSGSRPRNPRPPQSTQSQSTASAASGQTSHPPAVVSGTRATEPRVDKPVSEKAQTERPRDEKPRSTPARGRYQRPRPETKEEKQATPETPPVDTKSDSKVEAPTEIRVEPKVQVKPEAKPKSTAVKIQESTPSVPDVVSEPAAKTIKPRMEPEATIEKPAAEPATTPVAAPAPVVVKPPAMRVPARINSDKPEGDEPK